VPQSIGTQGTLESTTTHCQAGWIFALAPEVLWIRHFCLVAVGAGRKSLLKQQFGEPLVQGETAKPQWEESPPSSSDESDRQIRGKRKVPVKAISRDNALDG